MVKIDFWVEGIADQRFLADAMEVWFGLAFEKIDLNGERTSVFEAKDNDRQLLVNIRSGDGKDAFVSEKGWKKTKPRFDFNESQGVKNAVILDSDQLTFKDAQQKALQVMSGNLTENKLFLWPENREIKTKQNRDIELLLEKLIEPENEKLFLECWQGYESCLKKKQNPHDPAGLFYTPDKKAMLYSYMMAFRGDSKLANEGSRDYKDSNFWILDEIKAPSLKPLKVFLKKHLGQ